MLRVKVSTPWTHIDFSKRVPQDSTNQQFVFDFSDTCKECDFWIVWGGIKSFQERVYCPPENVIYLTDEVHEERFFNRYFLEQFAAIVTCRTDLEHKRIIPSHELNTWMVDRNLDFLSAKQDIPKSKILSVVCSDQTWLPGHKLRYAFVNKLIGHFKDKVDVFGRGFNPVLDKYDALAPYKYSIAIENSSIPGYFTEKISDCYLTLTVPVYYGCPNIEKYFDPSSIIRIDPHDFEGSVKIIESIIDNDNYDTMKQQLIAERGRYLNEYHVFSALKIILSQSVDLKKERRQITIKNERCFERGYIVNKIKNALFRRLPIPKRFDFNFVFNQQELFANKPE